MIKTNQKGFTLFESLIVLIVVAFVGIVSLYVFNRVQNRSSQAETEDILEVANAPAKKISDVEIKDFSTKITARYNALESEQSPPNTSACNSNNTNTGARVQLVYVTRSTDDKFSQDVPKLRELSAGIDQIFADSSAKTGGNLQVKWARNAQCKIQVKKITINDESFYNNFQPGSQNPQAVKRTLKKQGLNDIDRKYQVYVNYQPTSNTVTCGASMRSKQDSQPDRSNANNYDPSLQVVTRFCWDGPGLAPYNAGLLAMSLGAQQSTAPHAMMINGVFSGKFTDAFGILSEAEPGVSQPCTQPGDGLLLDCNNDDYFNTNPPAGSYLSNHWNIAKSRFLFTPN